ALAERVGLGPELAGSARDWKRRLVEPRLSPCGVTLEDLERGPLKNPLAPEVLFAGRRFFTPSGRVNLLSEAPAPPARDPDYPLQLMALSTRDAQSSQWAGPVPAPLVARVHPAAAAALADGARAWLCSRLG